MLAKISEIINDCENKLAGAHLLKDIEQIRVEFLGAKSEVKALFKQLKKLSKDEKVAVAKKLNEAQKTLEDKIQEKITETKAKLIEEQIAKEWMDVTLPGTVPQIGAHHPVSILEEKCLEILRGIGFKEVSGPEVEHIYYNFDALNIPQHHPARDAQDTFWLDENHVLRTHTTAVQARSLELDQSLPLKQVVSGRVYRNESVDATHLAMFHQIDGFWIDEGITFPHLKAVINFLVKSIYGEDKKARLKPKFYPYTEPSLGIDIECSVCSGSGCSACHSVGWVTIMGAGMIHPNVLREFGFDPEKVAGFAFGWGLSRMASQLYGLSKMRPLYDADCYALNRIAKVDE